MLCFHHNEALNDVFIFYLKLNHFRIRYCIPVIRIETMCIEQSRQSFHFHQIEHLFKSTLLKRQREVGYVKESPTGLRPREKRKNSKNKYPACLANINIIIMKMQNQSRDGSMYLRMVKVKKNAKSEVYIHHALQMIDIKVRKCRKIKTQHVLCNSKYDQRGKCQKYVQQGNNNRNS